MFKNVFWFKHESTTEFKECHSDRAPIWRFQSKILSRNHSPSSFFLSLLNYLHHCMIKFLDFHVSVNIVWMTLILSSLTISLQKKLIRSFKWKPSNPDRRSFQFFFCFVVQELYSSFWLLTCIYYTQIHYFT